MVRDVKYIIKRIIIGVGIALTLGFLRANLIMNVSALTSVPITVSDTDASQVINSNTRSITFGGNWNVMGYFNGYVVGTFSIQKSSNTSVEPIITPRYVLAMSSTARYTCEIGSTTANNSTYVSQTYTYKCPVAFGDVGLDGIVVGFNGQQLSNPSVFIVDFVNRLNFYNEEPNINFDTSGTTNAINNQINNDNSNTQNIINNENQNTQSIINNQNSNTDKEIESQLACKKIDSSSIKYPNKAINNENGNLQDSASLGATDFFNISSNSKLVLLNKNISNYAWGCFYNVNKSMISCFTSKEMNNNDTINIPNNASYVRFSINISSNLPTYELCVNGNQAISDSVNDLNNTLKDDTGGEVSSSWFSQFEDNSTSPVSDLLTMPITLLQAYVNGISASCTPFNIGNLYGTNIVFPCINLEDYLGSSLWSIIDSLCCIFLCYNIGMMCVSIYESITSLDDNMQLLYSPQHANSRVARTGGTYNG